MAVVKNLMVRAGADFSAITKQSKIASDSMKKMSTSISGSASIIKKALGAITAAASVTAIVAAAKDAKAAYDEQAAAEARLAQVMRNTMGASAAEVKQIKELCDAQQELGVVSGDVQMAGAQEMATYLETSDALKTLIPVMNDMAVQQYGYNVTAEQTAGIATMLGKVMEGQTGALSRYGYYFTEAEQNILKYGTEAERAATLAKIVESSVGGMNQALAQTPTGRLQQLSNTLGDIKAQFGKAVTTVLTAFLPALNAVASLLASIANIANRAAQAIANVFGKKLTMGTAVAATGAGSAAEALEEVADSAADAGRETKKARKELQTLSFDTMIVMKDTSDDSSDSSGVSGKIKSAAGDASAPLVQNLFDTGEAEESLGWLEKVLKKIKDLIDSLDFEPLKKAWKKLGDAAKNLGSVIADYLGWAFDNIMSPLAHWTVEEALPRGIELVASVIDLLASVLERVKPVLEWFWQNILAPIAKWTGEVFIKALEWITEKVQALSDLISGKTTFKEFLDGLSTGEIILGSLATAIGIVGGAFGTLYGIVCTVTGIFATVGKVISGAGAIIEFLTSPIGIAIVAITAIIAIGVLLYKNWDTIKEKIEEASQKLAKAWQFIKDKAAEYFGPMLEDINRIFDGIKEVFQGIIDFVIGIFTGDWERAWNGVVEIFSGICDQIAGYAQGIIDFASGIISAVSDAISWINSLDERISGTVQANIDAYGLYATDPWPTYASGGFPDVGQLFLARESGPEMVGTVGGRTAVANNSDIVAAIEGGVYNAMVSAMTASGGSRSGGGISVNINGREFMRAIWDDRNAVIAEHGVSLITNG